MARRSQRKDPDQLRQKLIELLKDFEQKLSEDNLREQVKALIPANYCLRDIGSSLITDVQAESARDRILSYLRKYPGQIIHGDELMIVAGISEYARRIRELRVELGWPILTGQAMKEIQEMDEPAQTQRDLRYYKKDTYVLIEDRQDRDTAFRWKLANDIRKRKLSVKDKLLEFFRQNVGQRITGEELKYLANGKSEWARRVRELRTEYGWPIVTRATGMPGLPVGSYVLEEDRQAEVHDRKIPDVIRVSVLERDDYSCRKCGWNPETARQGDRIRTLLELHHIEHHASGGENTEGNLITLCNICHDDVHRGNINKAELFDLISTHR